MIAEVAFDIPLRQSLSYVVPPHLTVERGQRVMAPLRGRLRLGMVLELRQGDSDGLQPIAEIAEAIPVASEATLRLCEWAAAESLSSLGSTLAALLPPPPARLREPVAPPAQLSEPAPGSRPELWIGSRRREDLLADLSELDGTALVIAPDIRAAGRWASRLDAARLDSGAPRGVRRAAWFAAARGRARIVVGTRSALLAPVPPPATLVLLDEHDQAHKPPGAPRMHSRDLLARRASFEASRLLLLSATPSCESWWQADTGAIHRRRAEPAGWPEVVTADTRGILRNHPLTLPLARSIADAARSGRRTLLLVSRTTTGLSCDDCGDILRCPDCAVPLAHARGNPATTCRLCARADPLPETCRRCGGHQLSPFGWSAERVEGAVTRRFPRLAVARVKPHRPATREPMDPGAQVLIGTSQLLRSMKPRSLGCVGLISLDGLLSIPDFRAGERVFQLLWSAAEAVVPTGRLVIQTRHPEHHVMTAIRTQDRSAFYMPEIEFRRELGYPPFRRLCLVSVRGRDPAAGRSLVEACAAALHGRAGITAYRPVALGGQTARPIRWQIVVKGAENLPRLLVEPLRPFLERSRQPGGVVEVEMDPVSFM